MSKVTHGVTLFTMGGVITGSLSSAAIDPKPVVITGALMICLLAVGNILKQLQIEKLEERLKAMERGRA